MSVFYRRKVAFLSFLLATLCSAQRDMYDVFRDYLEANSNDAWLRRRTTYTDDASRSFPLECRLTLIDHIRDAASDEQARVRHSHEIGCIPIFENTELDLLLDIQLPEDFLTEHIDTIAQGILLVVLNNVVVVTEQQQVRIIAYNVSKREVTNSNRHLLKQSTTTGTKSVYIVRVSTSNSAPMYTLDYIVNRLFNSTEPSFASQFDACSFGKLKWTLAGSANVQLPEPIEAFESGSSLVGRAEQTLRDELHVQSVSELADRIIFCVAPGVKIGWIATAGVNYWRARYLKSLGILISCVSAFFFI
jgi:hypothetical protein